ncbi:MAG: hypothetical protein ACYCQK_01980 [Acidiferrobacteraceae bacterium]
MTRAPSDVLSLTLPARSRSRVRVKRPRKPTGEELVALFFTAFCVGLAVVDLVLGDLVNGAWMMYLAAVWWRHYQRARDADGARVRFEPIGGWAVYAGLFAAMVAWNLA